MARNLEAVAAAAGAAVGFALERATVRRLLVPQAASYDPAHVSWAEGELSHVRGADGARISVESYGPRDGSTPQLVLSHGWLCTGKVWQRQVAALGDRVRIVTYDQPGHGRSSTTTDGVLSLDVLGDALMAVVRDATDDGPIVLAGHSLGGMAILNAFRRYGPELDRRVAGVVLVSTTSTATGALARFELGIRRAAKLKRPLGRLAPWLLRPWTVRIVDRLSGLPSDLLFLMARGSQGSSFDPEIAANGIAMFYASSSNAVFAWLDALVSVDEDAGLDIAARHPLTFVVGTEDRLTPYLLTRRMAARTGAELIELSGVGHVTLLEASDVVNDVLARHLGVAKPPSRTEAAS